VSARRPEAQTWVTKIGYPPAAKGSLQVLHKPMPAPEPLPEPEPEPEAEI
jgi:hypothetical protein